MERKRQDHEELSYYIFTIQSYSVPIVIVEAVHQLASLSRSFFAAEGVLCT